MPQATTLAPAREVERVLARFEMGCPALRDFQVNVQVIGRAPALVLLPSAGEPRGVIDLVFTTKGRLRTCLHPGQLTPGQRAGIEDLAWALHEALAARSGAAAPLAGTA